ncbi:hypothetical protein ACOZDE_09235 [Streptomyces griseoincarnatus]
MPPRRQYVFGVVIEETYRTYRHLMPGSITKVARILDAGLWDAA